MIDEHVRRITLAVLMLAVTAAELGAQTEYGPVFQRDTVGRDAIQRAQAYRASHVAPAGAGNVQLGDPVGARVRHALYQSAISENPGQGTIGGLKSTLPVISERSRQAVDDLFDSVSSNDAAFEVTLGQGRILTLKTDLTGPGRIQPVIAVGNPSVMDFQLVGPRHIRVVGQRIGRTDLAITAASGETYCIEVSVVVNLRTLKAQLAATFPDASLRLAQLGGQILVEGQARDTRQVQAILEAINAYLASIQPVQSSGSGQNGRAADSESSSTDETADPLYQATIRTEPAGSVSGGAGITVPQVINLLRVPGARQVLLKVRIAELNRTALREIGQSLDFSLADGSTTIATDVLNTIQNLPLATGATTPTFSAIPILDNVVLDYTINCLRGNGVLKILAEPNLIALDGHEASFHSGGRFPVPVPQTTGGATSTITIEWENFGVQLRFMPYILDGGRIRLTVAPEVSTVDERNQVEISGFEIPSLSTRTATTVVELPQGQSLAIAGLLSFEMLGTTRRIPFLGDLPLAGQFFRKSSSEQAEKELIVLVTPYLVEPVDEGTSPRLPGDEVDAPNDLELFLFGRIESRTLHRYRPTTYTYEQDCPTQLIQLEGHYIQGEHGFAQ